MHDLKTVRDTLTAVIRDGLGLAAGSVTWDGGAMPNAEPGADCSWVSDVIVGDEEFTAPGATQDAVSLWEIHHAVISVRVETIGTYVPEQPGIDADVAANDARMLATQLRTRLRSRAAVAALAAGGIALIRTPAPVMRVPARGYGQSRGAALLEIPIRFVLAWTDPTPVDTFVSAEGTGTIKHTGDVEIPLEFSEPAEPADSP